MMLEWRRAHLAALALAVLIAGWAAAQDTRDDQQRIVEVAIEGNKRIPTETVLSYVTLEPGDRLDERILLNDFRALWNTRFFSDLKIYKEAAPGGVRVVIRVEERPLVRKVEYRGLKAVKKGDIEEEMKKQQPTSVEIPEGEPLDYSAIAKVMNIIKLQMEEKGLEFGKVDFSLDSVGPFEVDVVFNVDEGGKVVIKEVQFVGNDSFSQWELTKAFKKSRPTWIFSWIQKDNIYSSKLMAADIQELENFYASDGFLRVSVGEPQIEVVQVKRLLFSPRREVVVKIPIKEGIRYRVDDIRFEGAEVFPEVFLKSVFKLKPGDVYSKKKIEDSVEEIQKMYLGRGYINSSLLPSHEYIPDKKGHVDVVVTANEGEPFLVNRIVFEGNRSTRDKVLRRNVFLSEQRPFNFQAFEDSMRRLQQLGFFGNVEYDFKPNPKDKTVDLTFKVTEAGKNQVQFGGGYSGIEGAFFNFMFSTANFWGYGQTLSFTVQAGGRNENYEVSFFDPWFMDRPLGLGVTFFSRDFEFQDFIRRGKGGMANFSYRVGRFGSFYIQYRYELVEIRNPADFAYSGSLYFPEGKMTTGSISPTFIRDTVDHPMLPTRGHRMTINMEYGSPIFGGEFSFIKTRYEHISHFPLTPRNIFRFRGQISNAWLLGGTEELPVFERYFMGGEFTLRGYELRTVGPRDEYGQIIGGTSSLLFNLEYMFLLTNEIRIVPFFDAGNAYNGKIDFTDMFYSGGVEIRFFVPVMNVPFRFILAHPINPLPDHRLSRFHFTIGVNF